MNILINDAEGENRSIRPWDGSIGEYKNYLRKKMMAAGAV
jgi:ATP-binding cassette subfamily F protein 2